MKPIFVMGTGRSGTSTVARLLHTEFDVCMGQRFRDPDEFNPMGYYEDLDLKNLNEQFLSGTLTFPAFATALENELMHPWRRNTNWGLKDPRLCELGGFYFAQLDPIVIRCTRSKEQVVASLQKCYGYAEDVASKIFEGRENALDNLLRHRHVKLISFDQLKSDEQVGEEIENVLKFFDIITGE